MISLAVTTYNRSDLTIESFIKVLDLVDEVVIVDDCSESSMFARLSSIVLELNNSKIKLHRNKVNLGPLMNKRNAVSKCINEWAILLDSDNIIDSDYIKKISELNKKEDVIYCPEILYGMDKKKKGWEYKMFKEINKDNISKFIDVPNCETLLNTGNYFFNRQKYLDVFNGNIDKGMSEADTFYFSCLWLLAGNKMQVVPELYYIHRIHNDSWWLRNRVRYTFYMGESKKLIKNV